MFRKKHPARSDPDGMTLVEELSIHERFDAAMEPLGQKATEYFRGFVLNNGKRRAWILPSIEDYRDVPVEKKAFVLKYREWFLSEIAKQELDAVPYYFTS